MWFDQLQQDLRYAMRSLVRSPVFALTAVLSVSIGIGVDAAVFTLAHGILLRAPSGVVAPHRLVDISGIEPDGDFGVTQISYANFVDLRGRATTLEQMCGYEPVAEPMSFATVGDGAERIFGHRVTTTYFAVHGVRPAAGRLFDIRPGEESTAEGTIVLSYSYWTRRFNRDPSVIGTTVTINGAPFTVVGIAAEDFGGTSLVQSDAWVPLSTASSPHLAQRNLGWALLRARLKPGVSLSQATAELETIGRLLEREYPEENQSKGIRVSKASFVPGNLAVPLAAVATLVLGFSSLVLVIACSNLSGMLLARATARRREIAVRMAIGASQARLVTQLMTETVLVFVVGGAGGLLVARALMSIVVLLMPALPAPIDLFVGIDGSTVTFTTTLSLLAALLCGLTPALQTSRADVIATLKDEGAGVSAKSRLRNGLVLIQVALSVVLVTGAGVFVRNLQKATTMDPGFDPSGVEVTSLDLSLANYTSTSGPRFLATLTESVRHLPGVQDATVAASLPTGGPSRFGYLSHAGAHPAVQRLPAQWNVVLPRYFSTMRIPLLAGRDFNDADREGAPRVIIISKEAALRYWPGQDPIGKVLLLYPAVIRRGEDNSAKPLVVIGVVGDVNARPQNAPLPQAYLPLHQQFVPTVMVATRTIDGQRIAKSLRDLLQSLDNNLPVATSQTLEEAIASTRLPQQVGAFFSGGLGLVGLLLAMMGIYGVTAFAVAQRTQEIGIRMALGATRPAIVRMVLQFGLKAVAGGAIVGLITAAALNSVLAAVFFGFPAMDSLPFAASALLFIGVGLIACFVPAYRAMKIDPTIVLRYE